MAASSSDSDIITLRSRSGDEIKISKSLLLEKSPHIKKVLERTLLKPTHALLIEENTENLRKMERFLVEGHCDIISLSEAYDIYDMAKRFEIKDFLIFCRNHIKIQINPDTVCNIHDFSCRQQDRYLQYHCWKMFDDRWDEILKSHEFSESEMTTVKAFVSRPKYTSFDEGILFMYVRNWAIRKFASTKDKPPNFYKLYFEKIREHMMPFLNKIRFLSMSREQLQDVFSSKVLSEREEEAISSYIDHGTLENLPDTISESTVKRTEQCYGALITYNYRHKPGIEINKNVTADTKFRCRFTPLEDCFLYQIIMPIIKGEEAINVEITILVQNNILFHRANYTCNVSRVIDISEPLFLEKDIEYYLIGKIDPENISSEIKIEAKSEFYIHDDQRKQFQKSKKEGSMSEWNKFLIKIRLYF